jgi:3-methyladenine DNA glycosylase AlkD
MTTARSVLAELKGLGSASYKHVMQKHGAREPFFGVKISELKKIQKRVGGTAHELALELWASGNYDAMYLAGLLADDARMTKADLARWLREAYCGGLAEYTVPWVAAGSPHGYALAREWIESPKELVAAAGWATLSSLVTTRPDSELDIPELKQLLKRVAREIHGAPNRVRYVMNGFVIAVGGAVASLTAEALEAARKVGAVEVDMGDTSCTVPGALEYIEKIRKHGSLGKKRKSAKC